MALFKTTSDLKTFFPNIISDVLEQVLPFVDTAATQYIIPALGEEEYNELDEAYNGEEELSATQEELLPYVQKPLAYFAFQYWFAHGQTQKSTRGVSIMSTDTSKTAWKWQIDDERDACRMLGFLHLEKMLKFLDANIDDYPTYGDSDAYDNNHEHFINFADDFSKYYYIENSRDTFETLRSVMREVEALYVRETIGADYYDELKGKILADTLTEDDLWILPDLKSAITRLTIATALLRLAVFINQYGIVQRSRLSNYSEGGPELAPATEGQKGPLYDSLMNSGQTFLSKLADYLNTNASDDHYATFKNSDVYKDPTADDATRWDNTTPGNDGLAKRLFIA